MTVRRSDDRQYVLASNATATGADIQIPGGEYMFLANGTIGGSTISLQIKLPDNSYADVKSLNGNAVISSTTLPFAATYMDLPAGVVRVALAGGTPSAINAWLVGVG
jgi:hypothetical protein